MSRRHNPSRGRRVRVYQRITLTGLGWLVATEVAS